MIICEHAPEVVSRRRASLTQSLLSSTALVRLCAGTFGLALSGALLATPAWADCSPQVANGVTAICTGATNNQGGAAPGDTLGTAGYGTGTETGVTVNVVSGAANTVTGTDYGINLVDATVINGDGANIAGGQTGIIANTGSANVTNSGSITGTAVGSTGIFAGTGATVINNAGGSITGETYGIIANAGSANVTNSGSITGTNGFGIRADTSAIVTNNAGGSITGGIAIVGLGNGSSIFNAGTISGDGRAIRFLGGGSSIFNAGTIRGGTSFAIQFSGTDNTLTLAQGSVITGDVQGTGSDKFQLGGTTAATFDISALGVLGSTAQYQGFGTLNKIDSSVWTLTGTSSYAGDINVKQGVLAVDATFASVGQTTVESGAMLMGTGALGDVQVASGGTFAPGDGTPNKSMTATSLVLASGAQYVVSLDKSTSSFAKVNGTATLGGSVRVNSPSASYSFNSPYTILTAQDGLGGTTFGSLATPTGISGVLNYTNTDVLLTLTSRLGQVRGLNSNQQNVATGLDNAFNTSGSSKGLGAIFSETKLASNLTQALGELSTAPQQTTFQVMSLFLGVIADPFSAGRGVANNGPTAFADDSESMAYAGRAKSKSPRDAFAAFTKAPPAVFAQRWNVWAAGYGGSQTTDGNAVVGSNNTTSAVYGGAAGADYWFSPDTVAGFALAGGGSNFSVANGGTGRSDMFQAGAFVRHNFDATYLTAAVAYGWQDVTTDRNVSIAGVDHLRANFNANAYSGRLELGHRFLTPWFGGLGVSPYAAAQITAFELPSYAERAVSGASTFALNYGADTVTSSRTELGLRSDKSYALDGAILTLRGRAAWAHDFNPDRAVTATFQTLPGASFVVNGAALASDTALTTASAEVRLLNGWSVAATFEGEFSDVTRSYAGKGVVRYNW